jgi:hypothetical protein
MERGSIAVATGLPVRVLLLVYCSVRVRVWSHGVAWQLQRAPFTRLLQRVPPSRLSVVVACYVICDGCAYPPVPSS